MKLPPSSCPFIEAEPKPNPQAHLSVEPWMRDLAQRLLRSDAGNLVLDRELEIARAYASERDRLPRRPRTAGAEMSDTVGYDLRSFLFGVIVGLGIAAMLALFM